MAGMFTRYEWSLFPWRLMLLGAALLSGSVLLLLHAQTRINPDQLKAPRVAVMTCAKPATPTADCTGLYYVDVITPAGTELKIVGTLQPEAVNAADWSLVP
jgi:hypothetical protein